MTLLDGRIARPILGSELPLPGRLRPYQDFWSASWLLGNGVSTMDANRPKTARKSGRKKVAA
jgi:hypothetical protein